MTERPTCNDCYHFVPNTDPDSPQRRDEGTCHARSPQRGGIHHPGGAKYSDAWPAVLRTDVACGSDFEPKDSPDRRRWRKCGDNWVSGPTVGDIVRAAQSLDLLPTPMSISDLGQVKPGDLQIDLPPPHGVAQD
jgi:hypothetical protein